MVFKQLCSNSNSKLGEVWTKRINFDFVQPEHIKTKIKKTTLKIWEYVNTLFNSFAFLRLSIFSFFFSFPSIFTKKNFFFSYYLVDCCHVYVTAHYIGMNAWIKQIKKNKHRQHHNIQKKIPIRTRKYDSKFIIMILFFFFSNQSITNDFIYSRASSVITSAIPMWHILEPLSMIHKWLLTHFPNFVF